MKKPDNLLKSFEEFKLRNENQKKCTGGQKIAEWTEDWICTQNEEGSDDFFLWVDD